MTATSGLVDEDTASGQLKLYTSEKAHAPAPAHTGREKSRN